MHSQRKINAIKLNPGLVAFYDIQTAKIINVILLSSTLTFRRCDDGNITFISFLMILPVFDPSPLTQLINSSF